jgi:hypothetical protein
MSIDFDALMLDPIYVVHGIEAKFVSRDGVRADLTVLDKTTETESDGVGLVLHGSLPAVCVRVSEIEAAGLDRDKMRKGHLTFNGNSWDVKSAKPKPAPGGKGELTLFLQEGSDG